MNQLEITDKEHDLLTESMSVFFLNDTIVNKKEKDDEEEHRTRIGCIITEPEAPTSPDVDRKYSKNDQLALVSLSL